MKNPIEDKAVAALEEAAYAIESLAKQKAESGDIYSVHRAVQFAITLHRKADRLKAHSWL